MFFYFFTPSLTNLSTPMILHNMFVESAVLKQDKFLGCTISAKHFNESRTDGFLRYCERRFVELGFNET